MAIKLLDQDGCVMESKNQRLLRSGKPKDDESLMSYIIRLTEQNGYTSPTWIIKKAELASAISKHCSFVFGKPEQLRLLSNLTGSSISDLASAAYPRVDKYFPTLQMFFDLAVNYYSIRLTYPKICSLCLSEDPYCRRIWDIAGVTTCPKHKCLLIDECPNCMRRITWVRNRVSVCPCEFDWREAEATPVEESEQALTYHMHQLCRLSTDNEAGKFPVNRILDRGLTLQDVLSVLFFFVGQYRGMSLTTGKLLHPVGKNKDLHVLFNKAYCVFEDWPNNFYTFLHSRIDHERILPLSQQRLKSPLYRDFGKFYVSVYKLLSAKQFDFIRNAFVGYLVERWERYGLGPLGQKKNTTCLNSKYISKSDAARLLEINYRLIDEMVNSGKLKTVTRSKGKKRLIFVDVMDIAKLMREAC